MMTGDRPCHAASVPTFQVRVAIPNCPMTDDDLDRLADHPAGWTIKARTGPYFSGFQLRLSGDADDEDAIRSARSAVDTWLAANGLTATVEAAETFHAPQRPPYPARSGRSTARPRVSHPGRVCGPSATGGGTAAGASTSPHVEMPRSPCG
jgi:hypothetical protein